ncbi:hypothetical protein [Hansschlegelia zhihuaiae]|uniref:Uncharacterized protein n=1 Tax=Hansschlegelia zhihuaiae TaxID=405005 RepID=A0A4Q0MGP6_9HYPH|nr:hypothetical protein [Hansschlegelia zhihuaiae]RXF72126.1 hypothetical protein EK403_15060 [Hansschlegelia zhihuaiae]
MKLFYLGMALGAVAIALAQTIVPHLIWNDAVAAIAIGAAGWFFAGDPFEPDEVTVNVYGAPAGTRVVKREGDGGRSIDVILDEKVGDALRRQGSATSRELQKAFGTPSGSPRL